MNTHFPDNIMKHNDTTLFDIRALRKSTAVAK